MAKSAEDTAAQPSAGPFESVSRALGGLYEARAGGVLKRRWGAKEAEAFRAAMAPALAPIDARFGRVMEKGRRIRTQPSDEALMRAAARALAELERAGAVDGLRDEAAALAVLTFYVGDFKEALHWVNLAARLDPDEPRNKLNGAVLSAEFLDFPLALRLAGEVLLKSSDLKEAWAVKARALQGLRLAEDSRAAALEKAGDLKGARALRRKAEGRLDDARSALREVVRIDPSDPLAFYELGKFDFTHGRLREAAEAYGRAVALDPTMKLAWYQKAAAHQMREEVDAALGAFMAGLALEPREASGVHFKVAAMLALKGEKDKAFEWIASGLALNKPNFYAEIYRIEFASLWGDPRWDALIEAFFADTGFKHTKVAQAEVGFSWGLFEHGSVLFYDSLADAFSAAEAFRREGDVAKAREYYEKLVVLLDREGHSLKAGVVRRRLESLPSASGPEAA